MPSVSRALRQGTDSIKEIILSLGKDEQMLSSELQKPESEKTFGTEAFGRLSALAEHLAEERKALEMAFEEAQVQIICFEREFQEYLKSFKAPF